MQEDPSSRSQVTMKYKEEKKEKKKHITYSVHRTIYGVQDRTRYIIFTIRVKSTLAVEVEERNQKKYALQFVPST